LGEVPVAAGTDGGCTSHKDLFSDTAFAYLAAEEEVEQDAEALLRRVLIGEDHESVLVVCISSMTDAAAFLRNNERLFADKVHSVTIMGGVDLNKKDHELVVTTPSTPTQSSPAPKASAPKAEAPEAKLPQAAAAPSDRTGSPSGESDGGYATPIMPDTANNNTFDMPAAIFLYTRLQELNIKVNVLTRFAAYGCPLPRDIYDEMQATGSPIALRLFDVQRKSIEELWKRCNSTGEARRGLPPRCSKEWYMKTFLGGQGADRSLDDSIWDLVVHFNMYDPMALILAVPPLAWIFFDNTSSRVKIDEDKVQMRVIGVGPDKPDIKRPDVLRGFMLENLREGVERPIRIERQSATSTDGQRKMSRN